MNPDRKVLVSILIASALGFALGFAPWLFSGSGEDREIVEAVGTFVTAVVLVGLGCLLLPIVPSFVIATSRSTYRRAGLIGIVVAPAAMITFGIVLGSEIYGQAADASPSDVVVVAIFVTALVAFGAMVGYMAVRAARK